jgi:membrane protease YdiL (CAAX protease family)
MLRSHVLVLSLLPLILNNLVTPIVVVSAVSLPEFLKNPIYYIYMYGFVLWSVYHVLLAWVVFRFLKTEKENVRSMVGSVRDRPWLTALLVVTLLSFSVLLFQVIEPHIMDLVYGSGAWKRTLSEFRKLPLVMVIYGLAITSLTAGICEEIVWRGYLQTRFERLLHGRIWTAILLQALLFGFWHGVSLFTLFPILIGIVCGYVYAKTRKLIPIMISHWLGDVIGFITMYFI